jgi:hypothetical protein
MNFIYFRLSIFLNNISAYQNITGTCKVRNEIETKRNQTKPIEAKRNQTKPIETKRNDVTFRFVSIGFISFGFVPFRFVSISFRTLQVPSFDSGFSKNEVLELIVFN